MVRPAALTAVVAAAVAALLLAAVAAGSSALRGRDRARAKTDQGQRVTRFPESRLERVTRLPGAEDVERRPAAKRRTPVFRTLEVRGAVALRSKPRGSTIARVTGRTEFGSPTTLSVAARRGEWLGVVSTNLPNGRIGWVRKSDPALHRAPATPISISVDLSRRTLTLNKGRSTVKRLRVAVGRPGSSTPTGRYAITDKLAGASYGPYYGCCILALSGHQPNTPAGWRGGDRLAIHGTNAPGSIGTASSAGCLRAADSDLRTLMRRVPLGTPVFIHG